MSVSVAGIAATPLGRPLSATWIVPVKPFCAVADTVNGSELPPACSVSVAGVTERLKSGGGGASDTASESSRLWLRLPEAPCSVIVAVVGCMLCAAVNVTVWAAPGVTLTVEGEAVTPCGRPLNETLT